MKLIIVESPAKCKKIESFLGKEYRCVASKGHIRDLEKGNMGIDIENGFLPNYCTIPHKQLVIKNLLYLAKSAEEVIIASDLDREGEAIGYHLTQVLGLDPTTTKRIVFNQITKKAITDALASPRTIDMDLFYAQQARRILDRLVGFQISPLLWKHIKGRLSAGRCQSVALHLVYERNRDISKFDSNSYFKTTADFIVPTTSVKSHLLYTLLNTPKKEPIVKLEEIENFLELCKTSIFKVKSIKKTVSKRNPPPPFITSTLQQAASSQLSISPDLCMKIAQTLYEKGCITYMRTDSTTLSNEALGMLKKVTIGKFGKEFYLFRQYKGKKVANAQEAHEAIRPVYIDKSMGEYSGLNDGERRLLELILKRTVASQMSPQIKWIYTITISMSNAPDKTAKYHFISKLESEQFQGYQIIYREPETENNALTELLLKYLSPKQKLDYKTVSSDQKVTKPVGRFTESSLIKDLEKRGIGRPSTFSSLIAKIQERCYVERMTKKGDPRKSILFKLEDGELFSKEREVPGEMEKNKLFLTPTGKVVNEFLQEHFQSIFNYNFTSEIEKQLDEIAQGTIDWGSVVRNVYDEFHPNVERLSSMESETYIKRYTRVLGIDPETEEEVCALYSKYGPVVRRGGGIVGDVMMKSEFASLVGKMTLEDITLEQALILLAFPKTIGVYKERDVVVKSGRYGHYITYNGKNYAIPKSISPFKISIKEVKTIIEEKDKKIIKEFKNFSIRNGPYGPYIFKGKTFISIPKNVIDPSKLTHKECLEIIKKRGGKTKKRQQFKKYTK